MSDIETIKESELSEESSYNANFKVRILDTQGKSKIISFFNSVIQYVSDALSGYVKNDGSILMVTTYVPTNDKSVVVKDYLDNVEAVLAQSIVDTATATLASANNNVVDMFTAQFVNFLYGAQDFYVDSGISLPTDIVYTGQSKFNLEGDIATGVVVLPANRQCMYTFNVIISPTTTTGLADITLSCGLVDDTGVLITRTVYNDSSAENTTITIFGYTGESELTLRPIIQTTAAIRLDFKNASQMVQLINI